MSPFSAAKAALVFLLICASLRWHLRYEQARLRVTVLDVGQGDSILIQLPYGPTLLVDAGGVAGNADLGSLQVIPELAHRGILKLDVALLTHGDLDHAGGFQSIFKELTVKELWLHGSTERLPNPNGLVRTLVRLAGEQGSLVRRFVRSEVVERSGARLQLHPVRTSDEKANNQSLVLEVVFQGCRLLFLGDLERPGELALLRLLSGAADVVKIAHHGSKTSSQPELVNALRPQIGVVSCGLLNPYGHPALAPLHRLRALGTDVLRTDFHGAIEFAVGQGRIDCSSAQGDCGSIQCRGD